MKNKSERLLQGHFRSLGHEFDLSMRFRVRRDGRIIGCIGQTATFSRSEGVPSNADDFRGGFGVFDPYPPLREKIEMARDK